MVLRTEKHGALESSGTLFLRRPVRAPRRLGKHSGVAIPRDYSEVLATVEGAVGGKEIRGTAQNDREISTQDSVGLMSKDWQDLAASSHYQTAVAVADAIRQGDLPEAATGIQELIDALARAEKRALRSQLTRLMAHVIKWLTQPDMRSKSWQTSINQARLEIEEIQEETPSLNRAVIEAMWDRCLQSAKEQA